MGTAAVFGVLLLTGEADAQLLRHATKNSMVTDRMHVCAIFMRLRARFVVGRTAAVVSRRMTRDVFGAAHKALKNKLEQNSYVCFSYVCFSFVTETDMFQSRVRVTHRSLPIVFVLTQFLLRYLAHSKRRVPARPATGGNTLAGGQSSPL